MLTLVFSGEAVFALPFHIQRFFRPTLLTVFDLNSTGLGDVLAIYGATAMVAYFPGGAVADRFSPRKLMGASLIATALGGPLMVLWPSKMMLNLLFGYWGVTTVLLFWAAMIRATRGWGGSAAQGKAFGFLDGGRGLAAAAMASVAVGLLGLVVGDPDNIPPELRVRALNTVVLFYSSMTAIAGICCWNFIPDPPPGEERDVRPALKSMGVVLRRKDVWLQAAVVVTAYCGFRGIDQVSLYAVDALGMNEVAAAALTTKLAYLRPIGCVAAGFAADRFTTRNVVTAMFVALAVASGILGVVTPEATVMWLVFGSLAVTFAAVYALRGVYWALMHESAVPPTETGTAVGLISVVGFTPDVFYSSMAGRILDATPGVEGHHQHWLLLAGISTLGFVVIGILRLYLRRTASDSSPTAAASATEEAAEAAAH